jgi:uncharacterized protein CbrC (UPF0167 family)
MARRFQDMGAPFPLFDAPVDDAAERIDSGVCGICGRQAVARFALGVGAGVMVRCRACGVENGLSVTDPDENNCRACGVRIPLPDMPHGHSACYACLRAGRAALTKDTELGMISWEQAFAGVTHGVPGLAHPDFEMVPVPGDEGWIAARLPQEMMFELLRTPGYVTIQGESWLFCCRRPMVYIGTWSHQQDFIDHAPGGDGGKLFEDMVEDADDRIWEFLGQGGDSIGVYVFRCGSCARLRAHYDFD